MLVVNCMNCPKMLKPEKDRHHKCTIHINTFGNYVQISRIASCTFAEK
jgi:hypothetical protein